MARLGMVQLTGTILVTEWQSVGPLPHEVFAGGGEVLGRGQSQAAS